MGRIRASNSNNMDYPPHNLHELRHALLDQWANITVEHLQLLVTSMPRRLAAIIRALEICN